VSPETKTEPPSSVFEWGVSNSTRNGPGES
jgi:hypothetical protein